MEYPGARFTRPLRLTLLIFFIGVFLVATPVVLLYTTGYRYDWRYGFLKETGSISVDILPKNAAVYLNGLKLRDRMPIRLNNITPGKHTLRIAVPGYYEWQKEIEVKNKQTAYIKDIGMLKKEDPELILKGKITALSLSPSGRFLVYAAEHNKRPEAWLRNMTTGEATFLYSPGATGRLTVEWSRAGDYGAVYTELPAEKMLVFDAMRPQETLVDIGKKLGAPVYKVIWRANSDAELYVGTSSAIYSYLPAAAQLRTVSAVNFSDWYMDNAELWTLTRSTSTEQLVLTRDQLGFPRPAPVTAEAVRAAPREWRLRLVRDGVALLANNDAQVVIVNGEQTFLAGGTTAFISPYQNWWLMWTPIELWSYTRGEEPNLLNRSGEQLLKALPLDKFNTLALVWADKTTVLYPYYFIQHDLLTNKAHDVVADSERRVLYFSGKILTREGVWRLEY